MKDIDLVRVVATHKADRKQAIRLTDVLNFALHREIVGSLLVKDLIDGAAFHLKYGFPFNILWAD